MRSDPGRLFAEKLADSPVTVEFFLKRVEDYFAGRKLAKLPKVLADQQEQQAEDAAESADEA